MPHSPPITEKNIPDQSGKVFIVTGATSGVGRDLAGILYAANAKIYLAGRSESKTKTAIEEITAAHGQRSKGALVFLHLDLNDLTTIRKSAEEFLAKEDRLDVLWNNAGVMIPPQGSKTAQGYELQLGTNNVAPFLFTKLLTPLLVKTAALADKPRGSVRVVWVSSSAPSKFAPNGGIDLDNLDYKADKSSWTKYGISKAGNIFHAREYAKRYSGNGILSVSLDPGNLKTDLYRHVPSVVGFLLNKFILYPSINGAYTELFAGLSPDVTLEKHSGAFIEPFGKVGASRKDIEEAAAGPKAARFWEWTEEQIKAYE